MNQEQNNFNHNNFNMQGNNGIPNNEPLNNTNLNVNQPVFGNQQIQNDVNFNNDLNQSVQQSTNINQPMFNPQSQQTLNFQQQANQMNAFQPTPQPMNNTFESGNINNQNFNSKPPKKMNLGLIIGIVTAVAVVGVGIVFGSKLLSNNGKNGTDNNTNAVNNIKNGTAKLVYTSKNPIQQINDINAYNYFYTYESGPSIVLDTKGNELFRASDPKYLGDTYFLLWGDENNNNRDKVRIYDASKKKIIYQFDVIGAYWAEYKNGILYYNGNTDMTTAYDLVNQKQLWSVNANGNLMEVTNEHVFFSSKNYSSTPDIGKGTYPSIVLDLNGNVVIEGNTDKIEYSYGLNKDDLVHTFVMNDEYYLKVKFKKYIEVYDYNHKLISNISLEPSETTNYYLYKIFDEGLFIVYESNKSGLGKYILYDVNKNIVLESDFNIDYASNIDGSITSSNVLALESASKYYLIKDGKIVEKFDDYHNENLMLVSQLAGDENSYLLIENNDTVNSIYTKQYINLKTLEKFDIPLENVTESIGESPTGNYIILSTGNDFYVYDSKFNLKYESTNPLKPINDKYVFEYTLDDNKMYVVNIENGKKNVIDTKGEFKYELSSGGFVTSDGTNYYLYAFN